MNCSHYAVKGASPARVGDGWEKGAVRDALLVPYCSKTLSATVAGLKSFQNWLSGQTAGRLPEMLNNGWAASSRPHSKTNQVAGCLFIALHSAKQALFTVCFSPCFKWDNRHCIRRWRLVAHRLPVRKEMCYIWELGDFLSHLDVLIQHCKAVLYYHYFKALL